MHSEAEPYAAGHGVAGAAGATGGVGLAGASDRGPAGGSTFDGEYAEGEQHGVSFVPAVFFGTQLYEGAMDVGELSAAIDARLRH